VHSRIWVESDEPDPLAYTLLRKFNKRLQRGSPVNFVLSSVIREQRKVKEKGSSKEWHRMMSITTMIAQGLDKLTNTVAGVEDMLRDASCRMWQMLWEK
jgi:hypothetical protein